MKSIRLQNFQGHKKTVINLADAGMTAITGKSDQGKSSIIRGVKWNRENKPNGTAFIRLGTKEAKVTVDNVLHERTAKENRYYVDGRKEPFKALRGAVPEEVSDALNLGDENIQSQHGKPFLLDDSPGKVAQQLSTLVDLEAPTRALKFLASKKRTHVQNKDSFEKSIEATEKQVHALENVKQADIDLAALEAEGVSIERLKQKYTTLYKTYENAVRAAQKLSTIPSTDALQPAKKLVAHYEELQDWKDMRDALEKTMSEVVSLEHILTFDPKKLLSKAHRLQKLKSKRDLLAKAMINADNLKLTVTLRSSVEKELQLKKEDMLKGECPLCGRQ